MNILLVSDIHFGVKKNSEFFLNITRDFFNTQLIPTIDKYDIQQLWILGDMFEDKFQTDVLVHNVAIKLISQLIKTYKQLQIKILCGNHDIYYKNSLSVSSLKAFERLHKNIEVIKSVTEYDIDGCSALAVPWLIPSSDNWSAFKLVYDTNKKYDICLGHFAINGFEKTKGQVEVDGLSQDLFRPYTHVFSGHFHIRSKLGHIQYLGSPYEINWNDYGTEKGITIFNTDTRESIFIENLNSPKHKHIKLSSIVEDTSLLDIANNNMVRFHIDTTIKESDLQSILSTLDSKNTFNLQIIDERYDSLDDENVEIDGICTDDLTYSLEYTSNLEHPSEISLDVLKNKIISYYQRAISEINNET